MLCQIRIDFTSEKSLEKPWSIDDASKSTKDAFVRVSGALRRSISRTKSTTSRPKFDACQAPELLEGGSPACASDIYALGMTVWEIFSKSDPCDYIEDRLLNSELSETTEDISTSGCLTRPRIPDSIPYSIAKLIGASWREVQAQNTYTQRRQLT